VTDKYEHSAAIAQLYAEALLPLAQAGKAAAEIVAELQQLAEFVQAEPGCLAWCDSPSVPEEQKVAVLDRALRGRVSDLACDAVMVIARHGRLGLLPAIVKELEAALKRALGQVEVQVTTAVPLDEPMRTALLAVLQKRLAAVPSLDTRVDPSILGGMVVRVGDEVLDVSTRGELEQIRATLFRRLDAIRSGRAPTPGI
jgi:F-type H+-transporting ATPase subunit delta